MPVLIRMEAQRILEPEQPKGHAQPTAWSPCDTRPITDALAHASEAQERTEDKGSSHEERRSLDRDTARLGWGSEPALPGDRALLGPKKSQESWR